jgi:hypothetical protein
MSLGIPETALLSTAYLGPIQYFTKFLIHPYQVIERYDHYAKQTYRNRCNILGANGILPLSVPVLKGQAHKSFVRDIRIDYNKKWQKLHWKSIESAYRHSPFFEFFSDEFHAHYHTKYEFLLEFNAALLNVILDSLDIESTIEYSDEFIDVIRKDTADYREIIHPKKDQTADPQFLPVEYQQVFSDRLGFRANLSIIDLLFNEGPNARSVLEQSINPSPKFSLLSN